MHFPGDLQYTKEHAWVRVTGGEAVAGITDHAQKELGDIVFVEMPPSGTAVAQGARYGVVESVKSVSDLIAPVSGTVVRVNAALASTPELVNKDPYGAGWIVAVTLSEPAEVAGLMDAEHYEAYVREVAG
jgi:glycine cleavage system H protein